MTSWRSSSWPTAVSPLPKRCSLPSLTASSSPRTDHQTPSVRDQAALCSPLVSPNLLHTCSACLKNDTIIWDTFSKNTFAGSLNSVEIGSLLQWIRNVLKKTFSGNWRPLLKMWKASCKEHSICAYVPGNFMEFHLGLPDFCSGLLNFA